MTYETWFDEAAGPLVRPYALTRGRTRSSGIELDLVTLVVVSGDGGPIAEPEYRTILDLAAAPVSVAEISAAVELPLGVVKILVGDLIERRMLIHRPALAPAPDVLRKVLHGLRRL